MLLSPCEGNYGSARSYLSVQPPLSYRSFAFDPLRPPPPPPRPTSRNILRVVNRSGNLPESCQIMIIIIISPEGRGSAGCGGDGKRRRRYLLIRILLGGYNSSGEIASLVVPAALNHFARATSPLFPGVRLRVYSLMRRKCLIRPPLMAAARTTSPCKYLGERPLGSKRTEPNRRLGHDIIGSGWGWDFGVLIRGLIRSLFRALCHLFRSYRKSLQVAFA